MFKFEPKILIKPEETRIILFDRSWVVIVDVVYDMLYFRHPQ
jgi:hypothetical protein